MAKYDIMAAIVVRASGVVEAHDKEEAARLFELTIPSYLHLNDELGDGKVWDVQILSVADGVE